MNRRSFVASLLAAAMLDPERLLWIPGKKTIFLPPASISGLVFCISGSYDGLHFYPLKSIPLPTLQDLLFAQPYHLWLTDAERQDYPYVRCETETTSSGRIAIVGINGW